VVAPADPPFPPLPVVAAAPALPPVPVLDFPPLLHPARPDRIRAETKMSARTLGWGKPMVMERLSYLRRRKQENLQQSVSGKRRPRHLSPEIILRARANRIYDHL
jgi:hypothetical protein